MADVLLEFAAKICKFSMNENILRPEHGRNPDLIIDPGVDVLVLEAHALGILLAWRQTA